MRRLAAAAVALLLAACAAVPTTPLPQLAAVPHAFEMSGRLALRVADRSEIARLRWTHRAASDEWVIASPLGNEVARISSDASGATLMQAGAAPERAASFAELTAKILGIALDPAMLAGWLHGAGETSAGDWTVELEERQPAGAVQIARRISAKRGDTVVRLVVDEYRALE